MKFWCNLIALGFNFFVHSTSSMNIDYSGNFQNTLFLPDIALDLSISWAVNYVRISAMMVSVLFYVGGQTYLKVPAILEGPLTDSFLQLPYLPIICYWQAAFQLHFIHSWLSILLPLAHLDACSAVQIAWSKRAVEGHRKRKTWNMTLAPRWHFLRYRFISNVNEFQNLNIYIFCLETKLYNFNWLLKPDHCHPKSTWKTLYSVDDVLGETADLAKCMLFQLQLNSPSAQKYPISRGSS